MREMRRQRGINYLKPINYKDVGYYDGGRVSTIVTGRNVKALPETWLLVKDILLKR